MGTQESRQVTTKIYTSLGEFYKSLLEHSPYSRKLKPCDFFLLPKIKTVLKGTYFSNVKGEKKSKEKRVEQQKGHALVCGPNGVLFSMRRPVIKQSLDQLTSLAITKTFNYYNTKTKIIIYFTIRKKFSVWLFFLCVHQAGFSGKPLLISSNYDVRQECDATWNRGCICIPCVSAQSSDRQVCCVNQTAQLKLESVEASRAGLTTRYHANS